MLCSDANMTFDANLDVILKGMTLACDLDPAFPMTQLKITALMPGDLCVSKKIYEIFFM